MADAPAIAPDAAELLGRRLEGRLELEPSPRACDLTVRLARVEDLAVAAAEVMGTLGMSLATLVATDEPAPGGGRLVARYVFEPASGPVPLPDRFLTLEVSLDPARPRLPSLAARHPAAGWHEREAQDLFGIVAEGHPDPRPLVVHDGWPKDTFPLRKSFDASVRPPREPAEEFPHLVVDGEGVFEIPVGPIHAGIIEPGHFRFSSVGETVLLLDARLFYTHRGLEKRIEGRSVQDGLAIAERLCGVCSVAHGLGFSTALERLAGVEVPARARGIRGIALELERLYNHAGDLGNVCAGASYHAGTSAGLRIKERLQRLNERVAGHRFLRGLVVPGGVACDLGPELVREIEAGVGEADDALRALMHRITSNPTVMDRFDETGFLSRKVAVDLATTGVAARASGVDRDARRDHPHAGFGGPGGIPVQVVTAEEGDVEARVQVRAREAHESVRLVRLLLQGLPPGELRAALPDPLPGGRAGLCSIESPRGASIHWLRLDGAGRMDRYHVRSASFANWPAVPLAALHAIVPDFPLVNKSFELCYACTDR